MTATPTPSAACPTDSEVALRTQGALSEADARAFDAHVDECPRCYALLCELAAADDAVRDEDDDEGDDSSLAEHTFGRYILRRPLGAGGMGIVHVAHDPELDREVAIKVVAVRDTGEEAQARLLAEAKALARLRHPNVVRVYDVGQHGPDVYLVMELVAGTTLTQWRKDRSARELLDAFAQVARGIAAAHRQGLVHRDIKPDNILIDADGRALIADFGLAAGIEVPSTQDGPAPLTSLALTRTGALVGSPRYIAPEVFAGRRADAKADQFSFCVSLYETLYGEPPFPGDTLESLSQHVQDGRLRPPPASLRVPRRVRLALLAGLSADPSKRFADMDALVRALTPRRRSSAIAAVAVASAIAALAWSSREPERCPAEISRSEVAEAWGGPQREAASAAIVSAAPGYGQQVAVQVRETLDAYATTWADEHHALCQANRSDEPFVVDRLDRRGLCLRQAQQRLAAAATVFADADATTVENAAELLVALPDPTRCSDPDALDDEVAPPSPPLADAVDELRGTLAELQGQLRVGRYSTSRATLESLAERAETIGYPPVTNEWRALLGRARRQDGDFQDAERATKQALRDALAAGQTGIAARAAVELVMNVGELLHRPAEGLAYVEIADGLIHKLGQRNLLARLRTTVGLVHEAQGKLDEAVAAYREAIAIFTEPDVGDDGGEIWTRSELARALVNTEAFEQAEQELERLAALQALHLSADHPSTAATWNNRAKLRVAAGDYKGAIDDYRKALDIRSRALGTTHPSVAATHQRIGNAHRAQLEHALALPHFRAAADCYTYGDEPMPGRAASARTALAKTIVSLGGDVTAAEREGRAALAVIEELLGPDHVVTAETLLSLSWIVEVAGRPRDAVELNERALTILETDLGPDHNSTASVRATIARMQLALGEVAEGRRQLERACPVFDAQGSPVNRGLCREALARAMWETPADRTRARALAQQARALLAEADGDYSEQVAEVDAWLDSHPL